MQNLDLMEVIWLGQGHKASKMQRQSLLLGPVSRGFRRLLAFLIFPRSPRVKILWGSSSLSIPETL